MWSQSQILHVYCIFSRILYWRIWGHNWSLPLMTFEEKFAASLRLGCMSLQMKTAAAECRAGGGIRARAEWVPVSGKFPVNPSLGMELYHWGGAISLRLEPSHWQWGHIPGGVGPCHWGCGSHHWGWNHISGEGPHPWGGAMSPWVGPHPWGWSHITGGGASSLGSSHVTAGEATSRGWGHSTCGGATSLRVGPRHWGGATSLGCGHVTKCGAKSLGVGPPHWDGATSLGTSSLETPTEGKQELPLCGVCQRPFQHCLLSASS